jgi:septum formation protein
MRHSEPDEPWAIVLASSSPRRLELARSAGWLVEVVAPPESVEAGSPRDAEESLEAYVRRLAQAKAEAVAAIVATGTIVACDTLSEVDGRALGKPIDREDAHRMLLALSGRRHRVVSGVCVWRRSPDGLPRLATAESLLEMAPLEPAFVERYLDSGLWAGKAGACGFQDANLPLRLLSGSPSNVVGLPLELVREMLAAG